MKKIISYIIPSTEKIKSKYSGYLEINIINGKKVLDTENANYSYGNLQKVLKKGLELIDFTKIDNILLLGLGGGSVIKTLRKDFKFSKNVIAIEIDPIVINVAEKHFGITNNDNTEIICDDAISYLNKNKTKFDFIIVDIFIDNKIPKEFLELDFWNLILNHLNVESQILFNTIKHQKVKLNKIIEMLNSENIKVEILENVLGENHLLIGKKLSII